MDNVLKYLEEKKEQIQLLIQYQQSTNGNTADLDIRLELIEDMIDEAKERNVVN